jgi:hypothetical protein
VPYSDLGRGFLSGAGKSAQDLFDTGSERLEAASTAPATDDLRARRPGGHRRPQSQHKAGASRPAGRTPLV